MKNPLHTSMSLRIREERRVASTDYLIGTGGWAHFNIPDKPALQAYSDLFNFAEVNFTFYEYPNAKVVEKWRRVVPRNFTFTVRCHQDLTHRIGLKPVEQAYASLSRMVNICRILDAPILHLLTPATYILNDRNLEDAEDFLSTIDLKGVTLAWEVRNQVTPRLANLMKNFEIIHSVDLSRREEPVWESEYLYTRLFGKGRHNIYQFTDEELVEIDQRIQSVKAKTAIVTYHGVRMTSDASRFKTYKERGSFPSVTAYTGMDSVRALLREDAKFPSSKDELVEHQGWKIVDLTNAKRIHLSELLLKIPEKTYHNIQDVILAMKASR